jgi:phosphate-selective porin OprO/OprP
MSHLRWPAAGLVLAGILSAGPASAQSQDPSAENKLQELEQKVLILERKLDIADEEAAKKRVETPVVTVSGKGFALTSPDKSYELKLRGYVQADANFVADDKDDTFNDTFRLRRVRPIFEGTLHGKYGFRVMPDFGGGTTSLQDAHADLNFLPGFKIRAGKFKGPVGLERLQSGTAIRFVERGLPTNLAPNRDLGIQVHGDFYDTIVHYTVGVFNGAPDGGNSDNDVSDHKTIAGRLFVTPARNHFGPFQNLGVGLATTYGKTKGAGDLGRYRTQAQQTAFAYRGGATPTVADGTQYRIAPQASWFYKQYGVLAEYTLSSQEVQSGANRATLDHDSWQVLGSWVLTGEENSFRDVQPTNPFSVADGTWGAWEVVARYGQLDVDDAAFPVFADPNAAVTEIQSWGLGLNWYLNRHLRIAADYEHSTFDGGGAAGANRPTEKVFFARAQVAW